LSEITEEVKARWQQQARLQLASKNAMLFIDRANLELAKGGDLAQLVKAEGLTLEKVPAFVPADPKPLTFPRADQVRQVATQLEPNRISPFLRTETGGFSLVVTRRQPVSPEVAATQLPKIESQLENQRRRQLIRDWLAARASLSGNELPPEVVQLLRGSF